MNLSMPAAPVSTAAPEAARPPESAWYRFKKGVILFFTGIDYQPHAHRLGSDAVSGLKQVLQPGDVILRRTDGTTSNWVIRGHWGHAAIYAGNGTIIDAVTHDVRDVSIEQFCAEGDAAIVVRPRGMSREQIAGALDYAAAQIGKPYDFNLEWDDERRFTCTELVATALRKATGEDWVEKDLLGIAPKDFLNDRFDFVWSSMGTMVR